jgi:hypothetical protein
MTGQAFNLPGELDLPIAFRRMPGLFKDMETDSTCSYRIRTAVDVRSIVFVSDETLSAILCSKSSETGYSIHIRKVERVEGDEDCISIDWADNMTKNLQVADTARSNFQPPKQDLTSLQRELHDLSDSVFLALQADQPTMNATSCHVHRIWQTYGSRPCRVSMRGRVHAFSEGEKQFVNVHTLLEWDP